MRRMLARGTVDQLMLPPSIGFRRCPLSSTSVLLPAVSPKPRRSTVASMPIAPYSGRTSMPAVALSRSGTLVAGVFWMSSRLITLTSAGTCGSDSANRVALTTTVRSSSARAVRTKSRAAASATGLMWRTMSISRSPASVPADRYVA